MELLFHLVQIYEYALRFLSIIYSSFIFLSGFRSYFFYLSGWQDYDKNSPNIDIAFYCHAYFNEYFMYYLN